MKIPISIATAPVAALLRLKVVAASVKHFIILSFTNKRYDALNKRKAKRPDRAAASIAAQ